MRQYTQMRNYRFLLILDEIRFGSKVLKSNPEVVCSKIYLREPI